MRIATWNINSVRLRIHDVLRLIKEQNIDVMCLQETKTEDKFFPEDEFSKISKPSRQEAPRRQEKQCSLRVVKILRGIMFGAQRPPGPKKSPRAKKEPPRTAVQISRK